VPQAAAWSLGGFINIKFWRLQWRTGKVSFAQIQ